MVIILLRKKNPKHP